MQLDLKIWNTRLASIYLCRVQVACTHKVTLMLVKWKVNNIHLAWYFWIQILSKFENSTLICVVFPSNFKLRSVFFVFQMPINLVINIYPCCENMLQRFSRKMLSSFIYCPINCNSEIIYISSVINLILYFLPNWILIIRIDI